MKAIHKYFLLLAGLFFTMGAYSQVMVPLPCDSVLAKFCRSIITDTAFNPYVTGVLGNWRANKSYTYYAARTEQDPASATDIRRNGTFNDFTAYWAFNSDTLKPFEDTTRWVWNSEITQFNRKGFEIENKDPLGRFNAGLYGYNLTMPTAVIQNSRYRESAFEGFEDYGFITATCDTACAGARHFDYSDYRGKIDTTQKHTGKSSLKLNSSEQAGLNFTLFATTQDTIIPVLKFEQQHDTCAVGDSSFKRIKTDNKILLPYFSPVPGKRMVFSAWVKEAQDCKCISYTNNQVAVVFTGGSTSNLTFTPTGTIIEGWQRYESVFDIPADATAMSVSLKALSATVYFDDVRLHPYHANMKSFVFHPVNLRLMAELDENNYATFYEYDDDGTLVRLKKETQRGIKTIKETRSALLKQ